MDMGSYDDQRLEFFLCHLLNITTSFGGGAQTKNLHDLPELLCNCELFEARDEAAHCCWPILSKTGAAAGFSRGSVSCISVEMDPELCVAMAPCWSALNETRHASNHEAQHLAVQSPSRIKSCSS